MKRALLDVACGRPVVLRQVHVEVKSKVKVPANARFTPGTPCESSVQHIVHTCGDPAHEAVKVSVGNVVVVRKYAGAEVKLDGDEHRIVDAEDILGVVEG